MNTLNKNNSNRTRKCRLCGGYIAPEDTSVQVNLGYLNGKYQKIHFHLDCAETIGTFAADAKKEEQQ